MNFVPFDQNPHPTEVATEDLAEQLRIEPLAQLGGSGDI